MENDRVAGRKWGETIQRVTASSQDDEEREGFSHKREAGQWPTITTTFSE
jgi:hypothetical protein